MSSILDKLRRRRAARNHAPTAGRIRARRVHLLPLVAAVAGACGDDRSVDVPPPVPVATVVVSPATVRLAAGGSATLAAVPRSAAGVILTGRRVTWSAAPAGLVDVDSLGTVLARAAGTATVTATSEGRSGEAQVVVVAPGEDPGGPPPLVAPTLATVAPAQIPDGFGDAFTMTVTGGRFVHGAIVVFGGVPLVTTFESATVLKARVTPAEVVRAGSFQIRVINPPLPAELYSNPVAFTVVARTPATVRVTSPLGTAWTWVGDRLPLAAEAVDLAGRPLPHRTPAWAAEEPTVAHVAPGGVVVGRTAGLTAITATVDGVSGRREVRVHDAPALGLVWNVGVGRARRLALWFPGRGEQPSAILTDVTAYDPSPSPDGRRIAFTGIDVDGNVDVYVLTRVGGAVTRLTTAPGLDDMPAWSPDGSRIAFRSTREGRSDVWMMSADGTGAVRLTPETVAGGFAPSGDPAWSPDGVWLAYASGANADRDIWLMRADGSGKRRLTSDAADEREPAWAPDGAVIAYRSGGPAEGPIVRRRVVDGSLIVSAAEPGAGAMPAYAATGGWLAFARATATGHALHVMPPNGLGVRAMFAATVDAGANVAWITP